MAALVIKVVVSGEEGCAFVSVAPGGLPGHNRAAPEPKEVGLCL